jgi:hypothetical protein
MLDPAVCGGMRLDINASVRLVREVRLKGGSELPSVAAFDVK